MLDLSVKLQFFDTKALVSAVDRVRMSALSKIGAFVRRRAKSSIRKNKATSLPGRPPHSHTGLLRNHIYFSYDRPSDSVVVGAAPLTGKNTDAPGVLEHGGTGTIIGRRRGKLRRKSMRVRPRPFMAPALEAERKDGKLDQAWRDSVR